MSKFNEANIRRVGAGQAGGGQFANKDASRSTAVLDDDLFEEEYESNVDLLSDEELLDMTRNFGMRIRAEHPNHGVDADDIAGELVVQLMESRKRRLEEVRNGTRAKYVEKPYLRQMSRSLSGQIASRGMHHDTRKAMVELRRLEEDFEQMYGRKMTSIERNEMADTIRMSYPSGKRPIKGFQNKLDAKQEVPLMTQGVERGELQVNTEVRREFSETHDDYELEARAEYLEDSATEAEQSGQEFSNEQLFMALASSRDMPSICLDEYTEDEAQQFSDDLHAAGGPVRVARDWQNGDVGDDDPGVKALFAPFKPNPNGAHWNVQMEEVCNLMRDHPDWSRMIWDRYMQVSVRS